MNEMPSSELMPLITDLSDNERAWIGFIRLISKDTDPAPTLARVQGVRLALLGKPNAPEGEAKT